MDWLTSTDKNIDFFHKYALIRQVPKQMTMLKNGDGVFLARKDIESHVLGFFFFFFELYTYENQYSDNDLIQSLIPSMVSAEEEKSTLTNVPNKEEIKQVVFSMNGA